MLKVSNIGGTSVVTITEQAAEKAKAILASEGKDSWGLRIYSSGGGCCGPSFGLDLDERPLADDEVIEKDGLRVFVDKSTIVTLTGMRLDYISDGEREGFTLSGGAAPSCGSSQSGSGGCSSCGH